MPCRLLTDFAFGSELGRAFSVFPVPPPIFCSVGLKVPSFGGSGPCLAGSRVLGGCKGTYSGGSPCFGLLEGIFGVADRPTWNLTGVREETCSSQGELLVGFTVVAARVYLAGNSMGTHCHLLPRVH